MHIRHIRGIEAGYIQTLQTVAAGEHPVHTGHMGGVKAAAKINGLQIDEIFK